MRSNTLVASRWQGAARIDNLPVKVGAQRSRQSPTVDNHPDAGCQNANKRNRMHLLNHRIEGCQPLTCSIHRDRPRPSTMVKSNVRPINHTTTDTIWTNNTMLYTFMPARFLFSRGAPVAVDTETGHKAVGFDVAFVRRGRRMILAEQTLSGSAVRSLSASPCPAALSAGPRRRFRVRPLPQRSVRAVPAASE